MKDFLALVESCPQFQLGHAGLDVRFGLDLAATLRNNGILTHRGKFVSHVPCGVHGIFGACSRFVRRYQSDCFAVCQERAQTCPQVIEPEYKDLKAWELDQEVFAATVKLLLDLKAPLERLEWLQQPLWKLGRRDQEHHTEQFFLLLQPHCTGFSMLIALLSNLFQDCWLLVPTWRGVTPELRRNYSIHSGISLVALSELLQFEEGRLSLKYTPQKAATRFFTQQASAIKDSPPFCVLYQNRNQPQFLTATEYQAFRRTVGDFSLVIDLQKSSSENTSPCACVVRKGQVEEVILTRSEANALTYLMRHRCALSLRQILPLRDLSQPVQLIERARRKVDTQIRLHRWTYFQTIVESNNSEKRYHFDPISEVKSALIIPYSMIAHEISHDANEVWNDPRFGMLV